MKGLWFSGGGIKAASHIGALKAFEEEGIKFDCVSGASSGSIIWKHHCHNVCTRI